MFNFRIYSCSLGFPLQEWILRYSIVGTLENWLRLQNLLEELEKILYPRLVVVFLRLGIINFIFCERGLLPLQNKRFGAIGKVNRQAILFNCKWHFGLVERLIEQLLPRGITANFRPTSI